MVCSRSAAAGFCRCYFWIVGSLAMSVWPSLARSGEVQTWRHSQASDFNSGTREGVIVSDAGRVRLARLLEPSAGIKADRVWALARAEDGSTYAATGDEGRVFRRDKEGGDWSLAFQVEDAQVFALITSKDGSVAIGTGPTGEVIELTGEEKTAERPGPKVQYVWDLAEDLEGRLIAATGPEGQLWRRSEEGDWELFFESRHTHLLSVAVGADGVVYTGSDGEGVLYKIDQEGNASVVFDSPREEIRTLLIAPDGSLYAGTAAGAASGGGSKTSESDRDSTSTSSLPGHIQLASLIVQNDEAPRGSALIRPGSARENLVFRVGKDGVPREVFRTQGMIYSLAWWAGRLIVGTGPEGRLFEVVGAEGESAMIDRIDHGQILALLNEPDSGLLLIGAGDPGAVLALSPRYLLEGSLTSDVLDAELVSRFGAVSWQAECPEGTSVKIQLRTGDVGEPDKTWSAWSDPLTESESSRANCPPGRFAQYRVLLASEDPERTPELRSLTVRYQSINLPPEIRGITIPDLSEGDGATRQTRLNLKWEAVDPNDDDLTFKLECRKEGWPGWVALGPESLNEPSYAWDTTGVPAGRYRLRLTASDRPSNLPDEAFEHEFVSEPFLVDHQAPSVSLTIAEDGKSVAVILVDDLTRLVGAEFAVDGGDWEPLFPDDGLFDSRREEATIPIEELEAGTHVLMVRATDAAGNVGAGDLVWTIGDQ